MRLHSQSLGHLPMPLPQFDIPLSLLTLLREGRVIPFLGAGFSAPLGLPGWEELLRATAAELEDGLTFEQINECCDANPLQIAEYFYLKRDRYIGPIRQVMSQHLHAKSDPVRSGAHVELINLGAPQT